MSKRKHSETFYFDWSQMERNGFYIMKNSVSPSDEVIERFSNYVKKNGSAVFGPDKKRRQMPVPKRAKEVNRFMNQVTETINSVIDTEKMYTNNPVILQSRPGCLRQFPHCDHLPSEEIKESDVKHKPMGVIITLMPGTRLTVWPGALNYEPFTEEVCGRETEIDLEPGDLLFFRGDLVHAGSGYAEENVRLHMYIDNKEIERKKNRTHIVDY